jgi:hypothetical protein
MSRRSSTYSGSFHVNVVTGDASFLIDVPLTQSSNGLFGGKSTGTELLNKAIWCSTGQTIVVLANTGGPETSILLFNS